MSSGIVLAADPDEQSQPPPNCWQQLISLSNKEREQKVSELQGMRNLIAQRLTQMLKGAKLATLDSDSAFHMEDEKLGIGIRIDPHFAGHPVRDQTGSIVIPAGAYEGSLLRIYGVKKEGERLQHFSLPRELVDGLRVTTRFKRGESAASVTTEVMIDPNGSSLFQLDKFGPVEVLSLRSPDLKNLLSRQLMNAPRSLPFPTQNIKMVQPPLISEEPYLTTVDPTMLAELETALHKTVESQKKPIWANEKGMAVERDFIVLYQDGLRFALDTQTGDFSVVDQQNILKDARFLIGPYKAELKEALQTNASVRKAYEDLKKRASTRIGLKEKLKRWGLLDL